MEATTAFLQMSDGTEIYFSAWELGNPKGVVQLSHGMAEHIGRYDELARVLNEAGYSVYGHDHRGHGHTAERNGTVGFFAARHGFDRAVEDLREVNEEISRRAPGKKIVLIGHSMGSFLARRFIQLHGERISAVLLSGTGGNPGLQGEAGKLVAALSSKVKSPYDKAEVLAKMTFGSYNKAFEPVRTEADWLSRDATMVDRYVSDPLCGFVCTNQFYADLFYGLSLIHKPGEIARIRKDLPVYLMSGAMDPVGRNGAGVTDVARQYETAGISDVTLHLYEDARHEIFNETNRHDVFQDVVRFVDTHV